MKGYGFLIPIESGMPDIFIHASDVPTGVDKKSILTDKFCEVEYIEIGSRQVLRAVKVLQHEFKVKKWIGETSPDDIEGEFKFYDHKNGFGYVAMADKRDALIRQSLLEKVNEKPEKILPGARCVVRVQRRYDGKAVANYLRFIPT